MLETLDHTIRIGSTPTFVYFDLYLYLRSTLRFVPHIGLFHIQIKVQSPVQTRTQVIAS